MTGDRVAEHVAESIEGMDDDGGCLFTARTVRALLAENAALRGRLAVVEAEALESAADDLEAHGRFDVPVWELLRIRAGAFRAALATGEGETK